MRIIAQFSVALCLALSAIASPTQAESYDTGTLQCGAFGPLSPYNTVLLANCIPEQWYTCLATDTTGCMAGDPSNIEELVARDPSTAAPAGGAASVSEAPFLCPETGMVSCSVIFTEEGKSKASLSIAIITGTAALLGSAVASPSILRVTAPKTSKRQVQEITGELGCTAKGPLAGPWAVELFTCTTDSNYTCQATEMTGCTAGDATNIESLMVLDSTTGQALSGAASIAEAYFRCPENGLVQCAVHFANNGSEASSYGLRITNATEQTPFLNATFGAPTNDSSANSTDTDSLSDGPTDSLGSEPTDSMSDSGFGSPTDSMSDSGSGNPTDSDTGFGSPTDSDTGFGSPSGSTSDSGNPSDTSGGFGNPTDTTESPASTDSGFGGSGSDNGGSGPDNGGSGPDNGGSGPDNGGSGPDNGSSGSDSDTVLAPSGTSGGPSSDSFNSQVMGSGTPGASSSSFSTSTSGFGSVPTDELSGFS
ncbi:hypothetical protein ACEPAG_2637 [Sanghuangporus baumii]